MASADRRGGHRSRARKEGARHSGGHRLPKPATVADPGSSTAEHRRRAPSRLRDRTHAPLRRTQEARSRAAREKLLTATLEVLRERGYSGLTTKEVAVRAGLSSGALMHHFSTKAELVIAAGAHIYEEHIKNGRRIAASLAARKNPLEAFISDCVEVYLGAAFIPTTEMMIAARADPLMNAPFQAFMHRYRETMNGIWIEVFTSAGYGRQEASFLIMSTLNLVRGMAINSIWQRDIRYYKTFLKEWIKVARSGGLKNARAEIR
jgi:AcrR family transcriptional regulator